MPDKVVTNVDLEGTLDTSDEWIIERTGIRERRVGGTTTGLAIEASERAMARAGVTGADLDLVLLCTCTPDEAMPASASACSRRSACTGGAVDLNAACSGFVYGLVAADGFLRAGMQRVLLIGSETMSRIVDWEDRSTAILFGDGAGAVVLEQGEGPGRILGWDLGSDGSLRHLLHADVGGTIEMDGPEVFRRAVRIMVDSAERALERAGVDVDDVQPLRPAPGQLADHRLGPRQARHPRGAHRRHPRHHRATPRRRRSRWRWPTPPTPAGCTRATSCSSSASAPACPGPPP